MGGRAFKRLYAPRMSRELYLKVRNHVSLTLKNLLRHVCVPYEMPSKTDFGDVDFLVAGPLTRGPDTAHSGTCSFDYPHHVTEIKAALNTPHGRKGFLTERIMHFAIPAPGREDEFWVQIDVKVCEREELFEWERFCLNYATASQIIGSMIKPVGLTLDPEGLHVRVEGLEKADWEKSLVFLTREPKELLEIMGLDRRIMCSGFRENDELFEVLSSSWLFNPAHFVKRLEDKEYIRHLYERAPSYVPFVMSWIPEHCPSSKSGSGDRDGGTYIEPWYQATRIAVLDKVFSIYPSAAKEYYVRRGAYLNEIEEHRLRELIRSAIPVGLDGYSRNLRQPPILIKPSNELTPPPTPALKPLADPLIITTLPLSPSSSFCSTNCDDDIWSNPSSPFASPIPTLSTYSNPDEIRTRASPADIPLFLDPLPRTPPQEFLPRPPPKDMSVNAKLLCLARWTLLDASGKPYLACEPREKGFEMNWVGSGADERVLAQWAKEMWWVIWARQARVNYVRMWKEKLEKEDKKAAKQIEELNEKRTLEEERDKREECWEKVIGRLRDINQRMRLEFGAATSSEGGLGTGQGRHNWS